MLCHACSLFLSLLQSQAMHKQHSPLPFSLTHTPAHAHQHTQTMLCVFGSSVTTGAEKAMCLQWQVHSGVSSVPTTRLQNNITLSSSAYADTHQHARTHTTGRRSLTLLNRPHKSAAEVHTFSPFLSGVFSFPGQILTLCQILWCFIQLASVQGFQLTRTTALQVCRLQY